ncbi:2-amino-4-hydroxy-6-hydroxymethyldihydropteridine diphosphokinase [Aquifex sp.]
MIYLSLGSNVGDRLGYLIKALTEIKRVAEIRSISTVYESAAWGYKNQASFLNLVVEVKTSLEPHTFLLKLRRIERVVGRKERFKWGPREIDIDILLWEEKVINTKMLQVPHPYLTERDFFLYPLLELNEKLIHPRSGKPLTDYSLVNNLSPFCSIINF